MSNLSKTSNSPKVTWILERNVFAEVCFDAMVKHFEENDIPYHVLTIIPFSHEVEGKVPDVSGPVIAYGSIGLQKLTERMGWKPGIWTGDRLNENKVRDNINYLYLNDDSTLCRMSDVMSVTENWIDQPSRGGPLEEFFIKPNTDTKEFAGTLMKRTEFEEWYKKMVDIGYLTNNDFAVLVSTPKQFGPEFRLAVCDGKIIGASQYKKYNIGKMAIVSDDQLAEFQKFVTDLENLYRPYDVYVVDVTNDEHGMLVVEYGTLNSAGLYLMDVPKLIDSLNEFVLRGYA